MKDYYALLGVTHTATAEEIKRAFRKLAVRYHPDKNPDPGAEKIFKELVEAYDVLGDWEKRKKYDLRFENPFSEAFVTPETRKHRDPRYRPKPPGYRPPPKKEPIQEIMARYLPYFRWLSWAGCLLAFLLLLDFVLPYQEKIESVTDVSVVTGARKNFRYFLFQTESGKEIKVYSSEARLLLNEEKIEFDQTRIFQTVMYVSDEGPTFQVKLGYLYKGFVFFPLILAVTSVLGVSYRKNVEFPFNLSIVNGTMLVINLSLLALL
jgi:curved DNA-binding protein CbpA